MINFIKKLKCRKCPYKLGVIKCIKTPCPECRSSGGKIHPFSEPIAKYDNKK